MRKLVKKFLYSPKAFVHFFGILNFLKHDEKCRQKGAGGGGGHICDKNIHRCPREAVYSGSILWDQPLPKKAANQYPW